MINLLPNDIKKQIRASRINLQLSKYILVLALAGAFLGGAYFVVNINLDVVRQMNINSAVTTKNNSKTSNSEKIEQAKQHLTNAIEIIGKQISYNKILLALGEVLPKGVIVSTLNIDSTSISNNPVTIKLRADKQDSVANLNSRFQGNPMFSNYQLSSSRMTSIDPDYPIDLTVSVRISKEGSK